MKIGNYLFIVIYFFFISCNNVNNDHLTIATAANMQFVMAEIINSFTENSGIKCEIIIGSSGKLTAQIKQGAPFDIFVSANMKYPEDLYKSGLTIKKPTVYAYGRLVLWSASHSIQPSLELLTSSKIKHIALPNPQIAPYGLSAIEVLKNEGIYESVKNKLVFGESVSQTNQFIISEVAQIGFTAKSIVLSPNIISKGNWVEMNDKYYTPIAQGVVILKNRKNHSEEALKFYEFLLSPNAGEILYKFGYEINKEKN